MPLLRIWKVSQATKSPRKYSSLHDHDRRLKLTVRREIVYEGENYKWGFQIPESAQRQKWFKLDLDPSQVRDSPLISKYHDPLAAPTSYDSVEKLIKDYLTALREHTERVLRYKVAESALLSTPIEYIVCSAVRRTKHATGLF